jgi:hypothetical protein
MTEKEVLLLLFDISEKIKKEADRYRVLKDNELAHTVVISLSSVANCIEEVIKEKI